MRFLPVTILVGKPGYRLEEKTFEASIPDSRLGNPRLAQQLMDFIKSNDSWTKRKPR